MVLFIWSIRKCGNFTVVSQTQSLCTASASLSSPYKQDGYFLHIGEYINVCMMNVRVCEREESRTGVSVCVEMCVCVCVREREREKLRMCVF